MGSEIKESLLSDIADIIDSLHITPKYSLNGYPMVRCVDLSYGPLDLSNTRCVSEDVYRNYSRNYSPSRGDIIITRVGANFGEMAYVEEINFCLGQNTAAIVPKKINPQYLYYILNSAECRHQMNVMVAGAAQPTLSLKSIKSLKIPRLDHRTEAKIATVIGHYNDKIALNRQINQTLEQMAQTLFKSWFVDFDPVIDNALDAGNEIPELLQARAELRQKVRASQDFQPLPADVRALFPAEFEESELGWVPKGWKASNVGNEFDVTMGQSPPGDTYNENSIGIPFFQGKTDFGFRFPSNRVYCTDPKRSANKNDTLISVRAPVGDTNLAASDCCIGRGIAAVRHKSGSVSFTYYAINNLAKHFEVYEGEGTVFGSINQKDMNSLPQLAVPKDCIFFFDKYAGDWDKKIELAAKEVEQLTQLRDTLLPKLISGELRLDEIPSP
ncbi:restriction endonuclease subunit S [uncultured Tolumonas sp.]|uniref:restriction endonuclease subunit S n=1 Tax=uncultured Tolumonas sp. TaxID=263765 RepID=UPI002A0A90A4|nr:restriction endonuclease subunit S [uncultured Tolumonas sp.]